MIKNPKWEKYRRSIIRFFGFDLEPSPSLFGSSVTRLNPPSHRQRQPQVLSFKGTPLTPSTDEEVDPIKVMNKLRSFLLREQIPLLPGGIWTSTSKTNQFIRILVKPGWGVRTFQALQNPPWSIPIEIEERVG